MSGGKRYKDRIYYIVVIIISIVLLYAGRQFASQGLSIFKGDDFGETIAKARIIEITDRIVDEYNLDESTTVSSTQIVFLAELLGGERKGEVVPGFQALDSMYSTGIREVEEGKVVLLLYSEGQVEDEWLFIDYARIDKLLVFGALFLLALLIFGRMKGFNTILSLLFTCAAIFIVFIPAILAGRNIYLCAVVVCIYVILMTFLIVNGVNKKTLAATLGCFGGLAVAGVLALVMDRVLGLTGFLNEESLYLSSMSTETPINLNAVIFAAIIIGAMGAIMDVSMSISSALWELCEKSQTLSLKSLYRSGLNIGRDIMGTMANTLILAYIGSSLSVVLLLSAYTTSLQYLLNREMIVVEILNALIGSFGILLTLPLTALISALIYLKNKPDFSPELAAEMPNGIISSFQENSDTDDKNDVL